MEIVDAAADVCRLLWIVDEPKLAAGTRAVLRRLGTVVDAAGCTPEELIMLVDAERPDALLVARQGSPVILGIGEREMFIASDAAALVRHTPRIVHLDDGEIAVVRADRYETSTLEGGPTVKVPLVLDWQSEALSKGTFAHYMHKEILEQPDAIRRTLSGRLDKRFHTAHLGGIEMAARELLAVRRVKILGCGSAYIAGCVGAQLIEQIARIPAHAEPASEFRYRNPVIEPDTLYLAVSQSGETFDTLAAVQEVTRKGGHALGIVNAVGSTIVRACGRGIYLHAGPEIAVVSTKTFTCTAVAFARLALHLGRLRDLSAARGERLLSALERHCRGRLLRLWPTRGPSTRSPGRSPATATCISSVGPPGTRSPWRAR
jgi:glucosamine--fructose-6-phosphate aminotransferase (isomerizing)